MTLDEKIQRVRDFKKECDDMAMPAHIAASILMIPEGLTPEARITANHMLVIAKYVVEHDQERANRV